MAPFIPSPPADHALARLHRQFDAEGGRPDAAGHPVPPATPTAFYPLAQSGSCSSPLPRIALRLTPDPELARFCRRQRAIERVCRAAERPLATAGLAAGLFGLLLVARAIAPTLF